MNFETKKVVFLYTKAINHFVNGLDDRLFQLG